MASALPGIPDWRDERAYARLRDLQRAGFAWEWLRRRRDYREAVRSCSNGDDADVRRTDDPRAARWGLHALEDPALSAPEARPLWQAGRHPLVLQSAASAGRGPDCFSLERHRRLATVVRGKDVEHLLLSDGFRSIRVDVRGSIEGGPVFLSHSIAGLGEARPKVLALRRLIHLNSSGQLSRALYPREARADRLILMLRAFDAHVAGASQREIAAELLHSSAADRNWRIEVPSLRLRAQRLVRSARQLSCGGYLALLR